MAGRRPAADEDDPAVWFVVVRDVSDLVRVAGSLTVTLALVLDVGTGLALGTGVGEDAPSALTTALRAALTVPVPPLPAGPPDLVVCGPGHGTEIRRVLARLRPTPRPLVEEGDLPAEADDIFDSLLAHVAGRQPPVDPPPPGGWRLAYDHARRYLEQEPWRRWPDTAHLALDLRTPEGGARYRAVVLGAEGVQRGLVLSPDEPPVPTSGRRSGGASDRGAGVADGTLLVFLDPTAELPSDLVARAVRHGWPDGSELTAMFAQRVGGATAEIGAGGLDRLTLGLAAVVAHDRRGPIPVGAGMATTGEVDLGDGRSGHYTVTPPAADGGRVGLEAPDPAAARHSPTGPPDPTAEPTPIGPHSTIDALFAAFLADQRERLAERTWRNYAFVVELLADFLNGYGYQYLDDEDRSRWEAAYAQDEEAYVHLFGAEHAVDSLGEFLGYFMIRKVAAGEELLRAAGTVTKKLTRWLAARDLLDPTDAGVASGQAADAARDLPRADKLSRLLHEHARRSPIAVDRLADGDVVEGHLTIERVEPGRLWFETGFGPVNVPRAATALAQVGWSMYVVLARSRGRWQLVEVGRVYP